MLAPRDRELDASSSESELGLEMKKIFLDGAACMLLALDGPLVAVTAADDGGDLRAERESDDEFTASDTTWVRR